MRKLKLNVDALAVESFAPATGGTLRGTVVGQGTYVGNTCGFPCNPEFTLTCVCENSGLQPPIVCGTLPENTCVITANCTGAGGNG